MACGHVMSSSHWIPSSETAVKLCAKLLSGPGFLKQVLLAALVDGQQITVAQPSKHIYLITGSLMREDLGQTDFRLEIHGPTLLQSQSISTQPMGSERPWDYASEGLQDQA